MRKLARKLTNRLICDLKHNRIVKSDKGLTIGKVEVSIIQRRFRMLDTIVLEYKGVPVWLPLLQRIKLRRTVRKYLLDLLIG